jgi:hypothetical protein
VLGNKNVGTILEYFDGTNGGTIADFAPAQKLEGDALTSTRLRSRFHPALDARTAFKSIAIVGKEKVGDDDAYVVKYTPEKGEPITEYVSAKTFLVLRREVMIPLPAAVGGASLPVSESFSDYRVVDGEKVPFRSVVNDPLTGEAVAMVREVRFNVPLPDDRFRPHAMKR